MWKNVLKWAFLSLLPVLFAWRLDSSLVNHARTRITHLIRPLDPSVAPSPKNIEVKDSFKRVEHPQLLPNTDVYNITESYTSKLAGYYYAGGKKMKHWRKSLKNRLVTPPMEFEIDEYIVSREIEEIQNLTIAILASRSHSAISKPDREAFSRKVKIIFHSEGKLFFRCRDIDHQWMLKRLIKCCLRTLDIGAATVLYKAMLTRSYPYNHDDYAELIQDIYCFLKIAKSKHLFREGTNLFDATIPLIKEYLRRETMPDSLLVSPSSVTLLLLLRKGLSLQLRSLLFDFYHEMRRSSLITPKTIDSWPSLRNNIFSITTVITDPQIDSFLSAASNHWSDMIDNDSDRLKRDLLSVLTSVKRWKYPNRDLISLLIYLASQMRVSFPTQGSLEELTLLMNDSFISSSSSKGNSVK